MALAPDVRAFLDQLEASGAPPFHTLAPEDARAAYRQLFALLPADDAEIGGTRELEITTPRARIAARLYLPAEPEGPPPVLIYFHGGGFVVGDIDTYDSLCRALCAGSDCAVVSVEYRLAPEHRFPAASEDCLDATRWIAQQAEQLGLDGARIALGGDSAGGNLAAVTAQRLRDEGIQYAMRLMEAGIDVELYNAPGAYHGADPIDPRTAAQAYRIYAEALGAALHPEG